MERNSVFKTGQELEVYVETISHQGEGVAVVEGMPVFVPGAAPGDTVRIEIISTKRDYARGLVKAVVRPGQRVEPRCRWFFQCGGCNLQHLNYSLQLRLKTENTRTTLRRIGGINPEVVRDILPTRPWRYRNKLQAPVGLSEGQLTVGLYRHRSHQLVPVDDCLVQHLPNTELAQQAMAAARAAGVPPWDEKQQRGILRHIVTRYAESTGQALVVLVLTKVNFPGRDRLIQELRSRLGGVSTVVFNENPRPTNVVFGERDEVIWGPGHISDKIGELVFRISARSFWQVNPVGTELLYRQVAQNAALSPQQTVLDIYCGTGSIGLYLAGQAGQVIGIESNVAAVADARYNAAANGIGNARFLAGRAEDLLPDLVKGGSQAEVVVLDPPRKGCAPALLHAVARLQPERIVYVSCNPATLARDLKLLEEKGYKTREVQPVDMFPHTHHVECVVLMSRVEK